MKLTRSLVQILILLTLPLLAACGSGSGGGAAAPTPAAGITGLVAVQTVFNNNCLTNCHEPAGLGFGETGLDLRQGVSYGLLFNQPATKSPGLRVASRDGANSVLFQRLSGASAGPQMPNNLPPLSASDQALVKKWIDDGAPTAAQLGSTLSGNQVSVPVATSAGGSGTISLNSDRSAIEFNLDLGAVADFSSGITAAHLHAQDPGSAAGPVLFALELPEPLPANLQLSGSFSSSDLNPDQTTIANYAGAVTALLSGTTYFQVHTAANPGGEIRGQVGPTTLSSTLDGAQVTLPVVTNASGSASLVINPGQDAIAVSLDLGAVANFSSTINAAHIHAQNPGSSDGPVIFNFTLPATLPVNLTFNRVLTTADLQTQTTIGTFAAAVDAMLSGTTYFQVHTATNPGGEIRGQILP